MVTPLFSFETVGSGSTWESRDKVWYKFLGTCVHNQSIRTLEIHKREVPANDDSVQFSHKHKIRKNSKILSSSPGLLVVCSWVIWIVFILICTGDPDVSSIAIISIAYNCSKCLYTEQMNFLRGIFITAGLPIVSSKYLNKHLSAATI